MEKDPRTTTEKRNEFLEALRELGTVLRAAAAAGVDRSTVYRWKAKNKKFAEELKHIREEQDDQAYAIIFDQIKAGDIEAAKWLLTRPARRFHDNTRRIDLTAKIHAEEQRQLVILEETGKFLAAQMADPHKRAELFVQQEESEK